MLLLGVSLSVGAVAFPLPRLAPPAMEEPKAAEATVDLDLVAMADSIFPTPFDSATMEDRLVGEKIREEFFRTQIPWGAHIYREARRNHLAPELVAAVVRTESDFRPKLRSHRDAIGLMQVLPTTGAFMGAGDLEDPLENIRVGTRYLRYLNRMFDGNQTLVLAAYNAGPGTVQRFSGVPPFTETQNYLKRVNRARAEYSARLARHIAIAKQKERLHLGEPVTASFASLLPAATQSQPDAAPAAR